jgi:MarR family transcriptional regulator for hemolysin
MTSRTENARAVTSTLLRLARVYRREVNRSLAAHAISDARAMPVLYIARAGGGMRQGMLAEELGLEGPSLVRLLDQVEAAGLVERRDDPTDRRAKTLHVTAAGQALAETIEAVIEDLRNELLTEVSDEDLAATLRTFTALEASLDVFEAKAKGS